MPASALPQVAPAPTLPSAYVPLPCCSIILYILVGVGAIACGVIYYQMIDSIVQVANGSSSGDPGSLCSKK